MPTSCPAVALTAQSASARVAPGLGSADAQQGGLGQGAAAYLTKPLNVPELLGILDRIAASD